MIQDIGNLVGQIDQHDIQQTDGPHLYLHAVERPHNEVNQPKQAFGGVEGIFNPPSLLIEGGDIRSGKHVRIDDIGQVAEPATFELNFHKAHAVLAAFLGATQSNQRIVQVGEGVQDLIDLVDGIAFAAGHEKAHRFAHGIKPGVVDEA
jgi:hypothetical protein